jgi:hypothetical protein
MSGALPSSPSAHDMAASSAGAGRLTHDLDAPDDSVLCHWVGEEGIPARAGVPQDAIDGVLDVGEVQPVFAFPGGHLPCPASFAPSPN